MEVKRIAVIGAGIMGSGIAQVAASSGYNVFLDDIEESLLNKATYTIDKYLTKAVKKQKLTVNEYREIKRRIRPTTDLEEAVAEADLIIEAINEKMAIKKDLISRVNEFGLDNKIFASNTSSLSITEMASSYFKPELFIGMHFFNPVPLMGLVELVKGMTTSEETHQFVSDVALKMGKKVITVNESPGFAVNRIFVPMINEAIYTFMEGIATAEDIDMGAKLGYGHPIGPLALADLIGLDTVLMVMETLYQEFSDSKYRPCPLLKKMVRAGYLGRKSGRGFFEYS